MGLGTWKLKSEFWNLGLGNWVLNLGNWKSEFWNLGLGTWVLEHGITYQRATGTVLSHFTTDLQRVKLQKCTQCITECRHFEDKPKWLPVDTTHRHAPPCCSDLSKDIDKNKIWFWPHPEVKLHSF